LVQNGTVDIECGSTTNNAARLKDVAFAPALYIEEVRIATKANSGINNIAQLAGKTVATTTGTTSVQLLRKNKRAQGMDFKELNGKDHSDSFLLLESGRADAFVMDGQILAGLISKAKNPADFKIVGEPLSVEPIAIMYRKDDPGFKKAVDDSIRNLAKSGEVAKLYDKWFMQPIPPANTRVNLPPSEATKAAWANPTDKPLEEYAQGSFGQHLGMAVLPCRHRGRPDLPSMAVLGLGLDAFRGGAGARRRPRDRLPDGDSPDHP
jgi:glutamate/aspartate transport system substrate-binding protein